MRDQIAIDYDYATGALLVTASEENHTKVETIVADMDDSTIVDPMVPETIKVQHVRASQLATTLNQMFSRTKRRDRRTGTYPVTVTANDTANTLLVTANKQDMDEVKALVADLDIQPEKDERQIKPYVLKYADLASTSRIILAKFKGQEELPMREQVAVEYDYTIGALLVTASEENHAKVDTIVTDVDDSTILDPKVPETIKVQHVRASQLASTLNQMFSRTKRRDRRTGTYPVTVTANDTANSLLVTAATEDMKEVKALVADLDIPPEKDERQVKPYVLKYADLASTSRIILAKFKGQEELPMREQVAVEYDYTIGALLVTASEENHAKVDTIVTDVDDSTILDPKVPETIKVQHVRASQLASTLNQMFSRTKRRDRRTGTYPVTVTANDTANSLLVTANAQDMEEVKSLVTDLDIPPEKDQRKIKPYVLQYADLSSTARIILASFTGQEEWPMREQVAIEYDYTIGAILVTASEENHEKVDEIVADVDDSTIVDPKVPETIKIQHVLASQLAKTLNEMISRTKRRDRRTGTYPVVITADDTANSILITANQTDMEEMMGLIEKLDQPLDVADDRDVRPYVLKNADLNAARTIIVERFKGTENRPLRDQVSVTADTTTSALFVTASQANHEKVQALIEGLDESDVAARKPHTITIENGEPADIATALTTIYTRAMPTGRGARMPAAFTPVPGTRKLMVTCMPSQLEEIRALITQLDESDAVADERSMSVVRVRNIPPREMTQMLTEYLTKPGARRGSALMDDVKLTASDTAGSVVLTGPPERLAELESLIEKVDGQAPNPMGPEGRQMAVMPLENADPSSVATVITRSFTSRGTPEAERVDAIAERATNSVVVTAPKEKLELIQTMIADLDKESSNTPQEELIELEHARAEDLVTVLTATYRGSRRGSGGAPISFSAEPNSNVIVVSAGKADLVGIQDMIKKLDQRAVDPDDELRIIPLKFIDAQETLEIMTEYLRKPTGRRSRTGSELVGDLRLQVSPTLNALIVSGGSKKDIDRVQDIVMGMDQEDVAGAGAPKIIALEKSVASQLAVTLTAIFTDPIQRTRGRSNPELVPLIKADEGTNSLIVRAQKRDFELIKEMVEKLDNVDVEKAGVKLIQVARNVDAVALARQIESTINKGESNLAKMQQGYIARQVAIGVEERVPALIVAGPPDMFDQVEQLVTTLKTMKPDGGAPAALVIPVNNIPAADIKRVLDQYIQQQRGDRRR